GEDPSDVRPEEAEERGRMQVQFLVGKAVMVAMMRGPPQHALLRGRHGHECYDELEDSAGFKRPVRKVAMIAGGDEEHTHYQQRQAGHQVIPMKWHEKNQKRREMHENKRQGVQSRNPRA